MAKETMTVYQALEKLKILENRVQNLTPSGIFSCVGIRKRDKEESSEGIDLKMFGQTLQSTYDKQGAILKNYIELKSAINSSNATTIITVAGKEYTIANALVRKRLITKERSYWKKMRDDVQSCVNMVNSNNSKVDTDVNNRIDNILRESKNKNAAEIEVLRATFSEGRYYDVYDPMDIATKSEQMLEELDEFEKDIHYALTQANVNTTIEVDFAD